MEIKNTLREEIAHKLKTVKESHILSEKIMENLIDTDDWRNSNKIFIFISFKGEVDTSFIIQKAKLENKKVYAPLITGKNMGFYRIDNLNKTDLVLNKYGIFEPPIGLDEVFPDKNTLMIVPGVAFSPKGDRLGRGGGFYDRYLGKIDYNNFLKIGIAFEIQILENIPTQEWDYKMDKIITELKVYGGINGN